MPDRGISGCGQGKTASKDPCGLNPNPGMNWDHIEKDEIDKGDQEEIDTHEHKGGNMEKHDPEDKYGPKFWGFNEEKEGESEFKDQDQVGEYLYKVWMLG